MSSQLSKSPKQSVLKKVFTMEKLRKGENSLYPFRSDRMFTIGHEWFFATREGNARGPYSSREVADRALSRFIITMSAGSGWEAKPLS